MPLVLQVKFLRVFESGEFMRVGSVITKKVNVRVIAATNKNLETEVHQKQFRPDLFYRLRSVNIHIPSLRQRREDIPLLMDFFAKEFSERNHIAFLGFSDDAIDIFTHANWNGNVRELRNVIESLIVIEKGKRIEADDARRYVHDVQVWNNAERNLPVYTAKSVEQAERELIYRALLDLKASVIDLRYFLEERFGEKIPSGFLPQNAGTLQSASSVNNADVVSIAEAEKRAILSVYEKYRGRKNQMAEVLGVSERTLYRKLKEYGVE